MSATSVSEMEALRARAGVRPMAATKDGFALADQDDGTYGYTSSPFGADTPLFHKRIFQSFECHRLVDGSLHLLGFVTDQESAIIGGGRESLEISLYPDPTGAAVKAVSLSLDRVSQVKPPSRDEGNFMHLRVSPIQ